MKFSNKRIFILLFVFIGFSINSSFGQGFFGKQNSANQYTSIGFGGGSSHYFGELSPYSTFYYGLYTNVRWNGTINYTKYFNPQFGVRFGFTYARIAGDDFTYAQRNLDKYWRLFLRNASFRNDIKEFSAIGIYNFIPVDKKARSRRTLTPYVFGGIGFYAHNPQTQRPVLATTLPEWINLRDYGTAGQLATNQTTVISGAPKPYSLVQVAIPLGLGARLKLTNNLDLGFEVGFRLTPTDYLDDIGNDLYVDPLLLSSVDSQILANRSRENISASTGQSRVQIYQQIYKDHFNASITASPSNNADVGYGTGLNVRGSLPNWDSYLLSQITINYVISSEVKCPPIR